MMYLQTLLKRSDDELTKKIYICQKTNSEKGDWIELIKKDFIDIGMEFNEEIIKNEIKVQYKSRISKQLNTNMLVEMKEKLNKKICDICYQDLKTQEYLESHMLINHEVCLLFSLWSRNAKQFKANFPY